MGHFTPQELHDKRIRGATCDSICSVTRRVTWSENRLIEDDHRLSASVPEVNEGCPWYFGSRPQCFMGNRLYSRPRGELIG